MKKYRIIFWITTSLLFLFEGVMPAFMSGTEQSIQGITGLGYPLYFVTLLTVFKVLGSIVLIVPKIPARVKEWAYAGFAFDFIFAFMSIWIVVGFGIMLLPAVIAMIVLLLSYVSYHKIAVK
jgi:hypothetical protein